MSRLMSAAAASVAAFVLVSHASAGFVTTYTRTTVGGIDQIDLFARNTGGGTGTKLAAVDLLYNGSGTLFSFGDLDGDASTPNEVDVANAANIAGRSFLRIGTAVNTFVVGAALRINGTAAPFTDPRWSSPVTNFEAAYGFMFGPVTADSGAGARFARFFIPTLTAFSVSGRVGGDEGSDVPFGVSFHVDPTPPVIVPRGPTNVSFGPIVSDGAPFSVAVTVTDADASDVLSLAVGAVAGIRDVVVTGGGVSPAVFTVTGIVDYSLNGMTVVVPLTATDGVSPFGFATGSFTLVVTPEPAALSALLSGFAVRRRRHPSGS